MISKELIEKAKKCTSKEEILELAKKENVELSDAIIANILATNKNSKELSDEELDNVAGGCTSHSSETYASLGMQPAYNFKQRENYHPVIVTLINHCSLSTYYKDCGSCYYCEGRGWTYYCRARSEEYDPA